MFDREAQLGALLFYDGNTTWMGTKYTWLKNPASLIREARRAFAALRDITVQSGRLGRIKESFRHLWDYTYVGDARTFFSRWYGWATRPRLAPIKGDVDDQASSQEHPDLSHARITSAVTETA